ncbi:MAG: transcription antitermination factor NusB [Candidatus Nomurabacteria bacterium]|jgi:N utilization substance protein B|nr:transcription antitermination factor NusB [Candidatus Nomurabacteria bacterium]
MASNRHLGRIVALQTLYEYDFRESLGDQSLDLQEVLARNMSRYEKAIGDKEYVERLTTGVAKIASQLDARIQPVAPEWPIKQISGIDRNVLRIGVFELENMSDIIPPKVAINEAVELAKSFGSENSSKFVNGVLGTIFRELSAEADQPDAAAPDGQSEENHEGKLNEQDQKQD